MDFQERVKALRAHHEELLTRKNQPLEWGNGIYEKYKYPNAAHHNECYAELWSHEVAG